MTAPPPFRPPPPVRAGFPHRFWPLFAWGLVRVVRWRRVLGVAAAAAILAVVMGREGVPADERVWGLARLLESGALTFALPLIALLLAAEGFSYEVQERTLVYHLVRPVSRTTFMAARFLSGYLPATLVATLFLATLVWSSGVEAEGAVWASLPVTAAVGILALGAIYFTVGALFRHGLIVGLVYTFVIETMVTSLPGTMQKLSVMFHVRSLHHALTADAFRAMAEAAGEGPTPGQVRTEPQDVILGGVAEFAYDTLPEALAILGGVAATALATGILLVRRRDFPLKD
jgi:ABC-type transport system involved in multi-copper enzyme maturation permease subunit